MDYVGSSRFIFDMERGDFPHQINRSVQPHLMKLKDVGFYMELNQLGLSHSSKFFAHVDGEVYGKMASEVSSV